MRDYARIVTKIRETPWLMTPEALDALLMLVDRRLNRMTDNDFITDLDTHDVAVNSVFHNGDHDSNGDGGSVGIGMIPLYGPIFGKANMMTEMSGATSLESFGSTLKMMLADDNVSDIILDIDSPGGTSDMVQETGELIRAGRDTKPIYAVANTLAGSAAYWLGSQATKLYATPSGSVGSIGVYTVHEDQSVKDEAEGRRFTFISAGKFKAEGNPHEPLSAEAQQHRQEVVDGLYEDFVQNVADGRGVTTKLVKEHFGQGRMVRPVDALKIGMIDDVMTLDDLVGNVANKPRKVNVRLGSKAMALAGGANWSISDTNYTGLLFGDGTLHLESKEMEHSEPGTGSPPQPRTDEDGSDDIAYREGWRRVTPPPQDQPQGTSASNTSKGGYTMSDEFVFAGKDARALLSALNLSEDTEPAKVVEALKVQFGELEALRNSVSAAEQEKIFAETYPQYWEEHRKLMRRDREHTAESFVGSVLKIRKTEGYGFKDTKQSLSVEAQNVLMATHMKFAEGQATLEDFETAIKAITNGGIVQFGQIGTTESDDIPEYDTNSAAGVAGARRLFAEQVAKVQRENPGMAYTEALNEAAKKHPDLAEAYKIVLPA